jgi:hypothetical protein
MLYSFSSCDHHRLLFMFSSAFYALCCICILLTMPLISPLVYAHRLLLPTCITIEKSHSLLFSACFSHTKSSSQSSSQLFIFSCSYTESVHHQWSLSKDSLDSLVVILNLFITSGHYPQILCLLWQS